MDPEQDSGLFPTSPAYSIELVPEPAPRKKRPILLLAGIALLLIMVVLLVAGVLLTRHKSVTPTSDGKAESAKFLQLVANGQNDEAYNMYYSTYRPDRGRFDQNAANYNKRVDLSSCELQDQYTSISERGSKFIYRCPILNKKEGRYVYLMFIYQTFDGVKQLRLISLAKVDK